MKEKATATPWSIRKNANGEYAEFRDDDNAIIDGKNKGCVAYVSDLNLIDKATRNANAELIVTAVNSHDKLVEAAEAWTKFWDDMPKGQLGKIVCDIGLLNDAFMATREALRLAQVKP